MFDPFGDFAVAGYLRNFDGLKDPDEVAEVQHNFFLSNLSLTAHFLTCRREITYADVLEVHKMLFGEFYPWAGCDRFQLGVAAMITKGARVKFEHAGRIGMAMDYGLRLGNDRAAIGTRPGHVLGQLAWGHPFLDGNGRTILVVHAELLHRAGLAIDWSRTDKRSYLEALTLELDKPTEYLDRYLAPFLMPSNPTAPWISQLWPCAVFVVKIHYRRLRWPTLPVILLDKLNMRLPCDRVQVALPRSPPNGTPCTCLGWIDVSYGVMPHSPCSSNLSVQKTCGSTAVDWVGTFRVSLNKLHQEL